MIHIHDIRQRKGALQRPLLLSLAVAAVFFVTFAAIFGKIAREVMEGETQKIDDALLLAINSVSTSLLDRIVLFATNFGGVAFVTILTAITVLFFCRSKKWQAAAFVAFAVGGSLAANGILKLIFQRDRPSLWNLLVTESTYSFPSGHAALSLTIALTAIILLWHSKYRIATLIIAAIYVIVIGFTRLYLGVHYPTDIIAGWVVAFTWVVTVALIMEIISVSGWRQKINKSH